MAPARRAVPTAWVPASPSPQAYLFLTHWVESCRPEPLEQLRYLLGISVVPLTFWLGAVCWQWRSRAGHPLLLPGDAWTSWQLTVQVGLTVFVVVMLIYQVRRVYPYPRLGWPFKPALY